MRCCTRFPIRAALAVVFLAACDAPPRPAVDEATLDTARTSDPGGIDACPFECCVYRDWLAEGPVVVRVRPDSAADVVVTIPAGQRFEADTGFVRITSPQIVVVTAPVEAFRHLAGEKWTGEADSLAAGDTLLVLEHLGEGHVMMSQGSDLVSAEQFWAGSDGWEPYGGARGRAVGTHAAEWWAHVRTAAGAEGWIDAYHSELGNVDACGA